MGQASAEARAQAARQEIEAISAVEQAKLATEASDILAKSQLEEIENAQKAEVAYQKALNTIEIDRARELAAIETGKFKKIVDTISKETLRAILTTAPDMQEKLLDGLGLKSFMIAGADSPLNMFSGSK